MDKNYAERLFKQSQTHLDSVFAHCAPPGHDPRDNKSIVVLTSEVCKDDDEVYKNEMVYGFAFTNFTSPQMSSEVESGVEGLASSLQQQHNVSVHVVIRSEVNWEGDGFLYPKIKDPSCVLETIEQLAETKMCWDAPKGYPLGLIVPNKGLRNIFLECGSRVVKTNYGHKLTLPATKKYPSRIVSLYELPEQRPGNSGNPLYN